MDKQKLLDLLIDHLQQTLDTVVAAAEDAKEAATNEESKAENKYDTRGLEASYLAGAQAKRADELRGEISRLKELDIKSFNNDTEIDVSALVTAEIDAEVEQLFLILPTSGGNKIEFDGKTIQVITPSSPVGKNLIGQKSGGGFELKVGDKIKEYEILEIS